MKIEVENRDKLLKELGRLIDLYIETRHKSFMLAFPETYRIYRKLRAEEKGA